MYKKVREYVKFLLPYKWTHFVRVRTHYFIKPHIIDQKVKRMFKMNTSDINLENVFYTTEMDREGEGYNYNTQGVKNINHLNLVIGTDDISKKRISKFMNVSLNQVGYIEPIYDKVATLTYVCKEMFLDQNHYNMIINEKVEDIKWHFEQEKKL